MKSFIKNLIFLLLFIAVAVIGYYLFVLEKDSNLNTGNDSSILQIDVESKQFLQRLKELENIQLSNEVLTSEVFQSLKDFTIVPEETTIGRENPFEEAVE